MKRADLEKLLTRGSPRACADSFQHATEKERQDFSAFVFEWTKAVEKARMSALSGDGSGINLPLPASRSLDDLSEIAGVAALATCSLAQLTKLGWRGGVRSPELVLQVMSSRRPVWIADWAEMRLSETPAAWASIYPLVKAGVCPRPRNDAYVLGMLRVFFWKAKGRKDGIKSLLLEHSELLEEDVWRLFEVEGGGEDSLAACDKYLHTEGNWSKALVELSNAGKISRPRLLDASLTALARDFAQFRAGWFSRFHEALQPTVGERTTRLDAYLRLLGSTVPPTVSFALDAIVAVDRARPVSAKVLLPALEPVLTAKARGTVKTGLRLIDAVAAREKTAAPAATQLVVAALTHEAAEVQKAVLDLLDEHGSPTDSGLRDKLGAIKSAVAASLRPRLARWLNGATKSAQEGKSRPDSVPCNVETKLTSASSRIDASRALSPIASFDELLDAAASVLENPAQPDDLERVLEGLARLGHQRPQNFSSRLAPLKKRSLKLRGGIDGMRHDAPALQRSLAMLFATWAEGADQFGPDFRKQLRFATEHSFALRRLLRLGDALLAGKPAALLSAATHSGGWIDPHTLVSRWLACQRSGITPDTEDQLLALLRLAPEGRLEALQSARKIDGESGAALAWTLGSEDVTIGPTAALWIAAARSRWPHEDVTELEKTHPGLGPDAGLAARYEWTVEEEEPISSDGRTFRYHKLQRSTEPRMPRRLTPEHLTVIFHTEKEHDVGEIDRSMLRWEATLCPGLREPFFARSWHPLFHLCEVDHDSQAFLELLADPFTEFRPAAALTLALGFNAPFADYRGLAVDALIALVEARHFNADLLADAFHKLAVSGRAILGRWARGLADVARVSPEHAQAVANLMERSLRGDPAHAPRDLVKLLELWRELQAEHHLSVATGEARAFLAGLKSGQSGTLAKALLAGP